MLEEVAHPVLRVGILLSGANMTTDSTSTSIKNSMNESTLLHVRDAHLLRCLHEPMEGLAKVHGNRHAILVDDAQIVLGEEVALCSSKEISRR